MAEDPNPGLNTTDDVPDNEPDTVVDPNPPKGDN